LWLSGLQNYSPLFTGPWTPLFAGSWTPLLTGPWTPLFAGSWMPLCAGSWTPLFAGPWTLFLFALPWTIYSIPSMDCQKKSSIEVFLYKQSMERVLNASIDAVNSSSMDAL
jgi:hypothetical protein